MPRGAASPFGIVTAFTIAHSISLSAAVAGFTPDALWFPALIELLMAASIFYVAIERLRTRTTGAGLPDLWRQLCAQKSKRHARVAGGTHAGRRS
jgi:hypothetical protein